MQLFEFIEKSSEAYHTIATMRSELLAKEYCELAEKEEWKLKLGGKYFVTRGGSSMIAFELPQLPLEGFQIVAAHTDSPSFKLKENPDQSVENEYVVLNVEKYGGMLMAPWFDRPLSVAGRVLLETEEGLKSVLVKGDKDLLIIPNLAIHMNREANKGYSFQVSKDMRPLFSQKLKVKEWLEKEFYMDIKTIAGMDLYLYNRMPGTVLGAESEFIAAPRLDDLQCLYASFEAFLKTKNERQVRMLCAFDHEEVGSGTRQGAGASLLEDTMRRIVCAFKDGEEAFLRAVARSYIVSADNAHGVHPNYVEKSDATNRPVLNGGVVIKYNSQGKYISDGTSAAIFKNYCKKADVPYQEYFNHSDLAGGSTLGHIATQRVSMVGVDIGLAQLAMHSPYETAGAKDTNYLIDVLSQVYEGAYEERNGENNDTIYTF